MVKNWKNAVFSNFDDDGQKQPLLKLAFSNSTWTIAYYREKTI